MATNMLPVTSPFDGSEVGTVPVGTEADLEGALAEAESRFRDRDGWIAVHERVAILERAAALMSERREALALQAANEGGKPLIDSRVEVARAIDGVRLAVEAIRTEAGRVVPIAGTPSGASRTAFTRTEPIGVVVAVSAFNHPLNLIVHQVAPAIAAGCPVIVKPADDTPLSCRSFVDILEEAGLPAGWCRFLLPQDLSLAERLVVDPRVGFFSFIGSARVGWMLRSKLAPGTRCALEHGGAAPLILAADADIESAVRAVAKGGFYHAGQVCVSVQRVFADESVAGEFAERLADAAGKLQVGDPANPETEVGPLIRPREVTRVAEWVEEARGGGAEVLAGGEPCLRQCYQPTVLLEPPRDVRVSREEVFGPVVCVYAYTDVDDAIAYANALPYAFQAAVFTRDIDTAFYVSNRIEASAVMVNDHTAFRVDGMPFAGLKQSGLGVGGIPHTIREMQVEKMIVFYSAGLG
ncbi:MAG: aldehyde dehydrogenase family protein [Gammaproteobacteria bacterium]|nr:aldehyde dehydrogenase family protein [Gammaproteobacteria bacterium]